MIYKDCEQCGKQFFTEVEANNYCSITCYEKMMKGVRRAKKLVIRDYNKKLKKYWRNYEPI